MLRLSIAVEIADIGHGSWWSEDLVRQLLWVVRPLALLNIAVDIRRAFLRAEDAVQPRHGESTSSDHQQYDHRNPQPPQNPENRNLPGLFPRLAACSNMQLQTVSGAPYHVIPIDVGVGSWHCHSHLKRAATRGARRGRDTQTMPVASRSALEHL